MVIELLSALEQKMVATGYDSLSLKEKNDLVAIIANKEGLKYSDITDEYILNYHKSIKVDILSEDCDNAITGGFTSTNGNQYRTNRDDQTNMIGQMLQLMNDATVTTVKWKTLNAGYVDHTKDDWIQHVFSEGLSFKQRTLFQYDTLVSQVNAATTDAAVLAVVWQ